MKKRFQVQQEPNWWFEAVACLEQRTLQSEEEMIENHDRFGFAKEDMQAVFAPLMNYKTMVWHETEPLLAEYSHMKDFWYAEDDQGSLFRNVLPHVQSLFEQQEYSKEESDRAINQALSALLTDQDADDKTAVVDLVTVLTAVTKSTLSDHRKLQIINFYNNRYQLLQDMKALLQHAAKICAQHATIVKQEIAACLQELSANDSIIASKLILDLDTEMTVYASIFAFNSVMLQEVNENIVIQSGIFVYSISKWKEQNKFNDAQLITAMKALSDPTRMKILQLLSQKRFYLQEIADHLHLTPATISHHIGILGPSEFLIFHVDQTSRKLYYELNRSRLAELGKSLVEMAGKEYYEQEQ